jgi:hypothetical protein
MSIQKSESTLWLDPAMGLSGDMFAAALLDLGARPREMVAAMKAAGDLFGVVDIYSHVQFLTDDTPAHQLHIHWLADTETLPFDRAQSYLDQALTQTSVRGKYARFAQRVLAALTKAETLAHADEQLAPWPVEQVSLSIIGVAHTPYRNDAPYQPLQEANAEDAFYVELHPQYAAGLADLHTFSHLLVISYLNRSAGYIRGTRNENSQQSYFIQGDLSYANSAFSRYQHWIGQHHQPTFWTLSLLYFCRPGRKRSERR